MRVYVCFRVYASIRSQVYVCCPRFFLLFCRNEANICNAFITLQLYLRNMEDGFYQAFIPADPEAPPRMHELQTSE